MYLQLLTFVQAKYRFIAYSIAIVCGYIVITTGSAQATTGLSIEPDSDLFDSDNISPSQIVDRTTIESEADLVRFDFDNDNISSSKLFSKISIESNSQGIASNHIETSKPDSEDSIKVNSIDRNSPSQLLSKTTI
ncbi:MAG: hypothetical protein RLZZ135_1117, partial [Cyanobacteriota bacterium]